MTEKRKSLEEPPPSATSSNEGASGTETTDVNQRMASLENEILDFLCQNNEIVFKSQQIDDPELTMNEKKGIANEILQENRGKFLLRFGRYLQTEHLNYFEFKHNDEGDEMNVDENEDYEVKFLLNDLRKNLEHKQKNIKNRRYAAMQALIKANSYFSEKEMMRREPNLYEQLVGQYLTESEKRIRDGYDPKNTTFSNILFDKIDKERMDELRKKQENEEQISDEDLSQSSSRDDGNSSMSSESGTPPACRKQWGNFEDESDNQPATSRRNDSTRKQKQQKFVTAEEREMLRQEFIGIMYSKFLEGKEDFDYSQVDNNADLDDLNQINQDKEDKYFDDSDDDDNLDITSRHIGRMHEDIESEDDLDVYMKHLSKHPGLRERYVS